VFSQWRGKAFYICAAYRTPQQRPEDDFLVRRARMTLEGFGRFELAHFVIPSIGSLCTAD